MTTQAEKNILAISERRFRYKPIKSNALVIIFTGLNIDLTASKSACIMGIVKNIKS